MPAVPTCPSAFVVQLSRDGIAYYDVSAWTRRIAATGGTRDVVRYHTSAGPSLAATPPADVEIALEQLWTDVVNEPYDWIRAAFWSGSRLYVRWWTPNVFKPWNGVGIITDFDEPVVDADGDEPLGFVAIVTCRALGWG